MPRLSYNRQAYRLTAGGVTWHFDINILQDSLKYSANRSLEPLGHLEGITLTHADTPRMHYFGGIPYASPPIGQLRFRRPRPLPDGHQYGSEAKPGKFTGGTGFCPQPPRNPNINSSNWNEDCLQLNVYIPAGKPAPAHGWPVFFYIHGGFLQWGSANDPPHAIAPLLSETAFEAIIVNASYRTNLFGFLSSNELQQEAHFDGEVAGNLGFWDQRTALEWTSKNIVHFGGDASNITVGGYSAGAHSAFHQLAHELYFVPDHKAIIKRVICWSNSPGVQPRTVAQHQEQFKELLTALKIPLSLSSYEKLKRLRALSPKQLVDVQDTMKICEYRATTDNSFVWKDLMTNINSGDFAQRMKARKIKFMNGECQEEHNLYRSWRTPADSYDAVRTRLIGDYPVDVVDKLMNLYCRGSKILPADFRDWPDLFGHIYADMQVHHLERGFHCTLANAGLKYGEDIFRYRFEWRAKCVDAVYPPEWGVTHATDMAIWLWGLDFGPGLSDEDKEVLKTWNADFAAFVKGERPDWGTRALRDVKCLRADGSTGIWHDDRLEKGMRVWALVNGTISGSLRSNL